LGVGVFWPNPGGIPKYFLENINKINIIKNFNFLKTSIKFY